MNEQIESQFAHHYNRRMETITVDLEADVLYQLMLMAHERDITLNTLVNIVLRDYLDSIKAAAPAEPTQGE